ncbi:MAG: PfkB family carbohydrate kinase [Deltaproteobacteria bacterium]|nr:PfkB family carbohydrate kinase [Deltaproteobacteria bacterium]
MSASQQGGPGAHFDVVGLGLNAVDTLLVVPEYPQFNTKIEITDHAQTGGGQVATALVACQRWGLRTKYIGAVGDDEAGRFQRRSLREEGLDISDLLEVPGAFTQMATIIVESRSGERTILWRRDEKLKRDPATLPEEAIARGRVLLVDGHEIPLSIRAAGIARARGMPVILDIDSVREGSRELLALVDYPVVSETFAPRLTGKAAIVEALREVQRLSAGGFACATLGSGGALALSPEGDMRVGAAGVKAVDTTGAGDVFHGGFAYGLVRGWDLARTLRFAAAAASLNCTGYGARGGIRSLEEVEREAGALRVEPLTASR